MANARRGQRTLKAGLAGRLVPPMSEIAPDVDGWARGHGFEPSNEEIGGATPLLRLGFLDVLPCAVRDRPPGGIDTRASIFAFARSPRIDDLDHLESTADRDIGIGAICAVSYWQPSYRPASRRAKR